MEWVVQLFWGKKKRNPAGLDFRYSGPLGAMEPTLPHLPAEAVVVLGLGNGDARMSQEVRIQG